jgi:hypothetical protein
LTGFATQSNKHDRLLNELSQLFNHEEMHGLNCQDKLMEPPPQKSHPRRSDSAPKRASPTDTESRSTIHKPMIPPLRSVQVQKDTVRRESLESIIHVLEESHKLYVSQVNERLQFYETIAKTFFKE